MPALEFPRHHVASLVELATRLLDSRKVGSDNALLARDLLVGFFDTCMRSGLDGVLVELAQAFTPLDITDRFALSEHPRLNSALVAQLGPLDLDGGGPRSAKPLQLADCVVAALGLTLIDEEDRTIVLDDTVRTAVVAALASVVNVELAVPQIRESIIATAREKCESQYHAAFNRIVAQLDEHGMRMIKEPKVSLDASQAVQRVLFAARNAVIEQMSRTAIERAKLVIEKADADAAARIDLPITLRLTPRDVAVLRACDARTPKVPAAVVHSLLESLTELSRLAWRAPEKPVRQYSASQTFAVGDLIDHPKFGRGTVTSCLAQRIEVEFDDGSHTLIHVRAVK